jgi:hypothetical protein
MKTELSKWKRGERDKLKEIITMLEFGLALSLALQRLFCFKTFQSQLSQK